MERPSDPRTLRLVQDASQGDSAAIDALLARYLPELNAYLRLRMGRAVAARETPSDVAQSVCREVLEDLSAFEYRDETSFKRWLFLHAQRKIVSKGRFHGRQRRDFGREDRLQDSEFARAAIDLLTPSRHAAAREELDLFARSVEALPEDQRRAVVLCRGLGMTPSEAAGELGKTPNAVRVCLHRGLARLALLQERRESAEERRRPEPPPPDVNGRP